MGFKWRVHDRRLLVADGEAAVYLGRGQAEALMTAVSDELYRGALWLRLTFREDEHGLIHFAATVESPNPDEPASPQ